ncbi:MAG TPA: hypothetical protein ENN56_01660 [Firmicutes bacterium]|nr:hypothetical protein [Bacillota bacterium]
MTWLHEHDHARAGKPWFLCASFSRPHFPLTAPRRFFDRYWPNGVTPPKTGPGDTHDHPMTRGMRAGFHTDEIGSEEAMRARAAYFACVDYLDEILSDFLTLLDADGFLENTIIVYTTDHGELAGEHGLWWKNSWHEAATRVPWFIQTPEHRSGAIAPRDVDTPVSLADLFPTLAGLCGVETPSDIDGIDLSNSVIDSGEPAQRPVFCDALTPRWGAGTEFRMVRDGTWKYVAFRNAPPILIDLESDPYEQHSLAGTADASVEAKDAERRLAKIVAESIDFDDVEAERLRDEQLTKEHALRIKPGYRNMYLLADGRLIDADREIYEPPVLSDDPATTFADFPGRDRSE